MALNQAQKISLALMPKFSSFLSIFGSAWIVLEVAGDREKQKQMYHRLMAIFALLDMVISVFYFMSTWPMPEDDSELVWSRGNDATCQLQGFFIQLGSSAFIYVRRYDSTRHEFGTKSLVVLTHHTPLTFILRLSFPL